MRKVMLAGFLVFAYAVASFGAFPSIKQLFTQFFPVAPSFAAVQNEGHSTVIHPIRERTLCAPQKS